METSNEEELPDSEVRFNTEGVYSGRTIDQNERVWTWIWTGSEIKFKADCPVPAGVRDNAEMLIGALIEQSRGPRW